jgi:hypothetical protein
VALDLFVGVVLIGHMKPLMLKCPGGGHGSLKRRHHERGSKLPSRRLAIESTRKDDASMWDSSLSKR